MTSGKALVSRQEGDILKQLADFPSMIEAAAEARAPYKVAGYIHSLAQSIHEYYAATKIIDHDDKEGTGCRLALMKATMITLENALGFSVSAPRTRCKEIEGEKVMDNTKSMLDVALRTHEQNQEDGDLHRSL
jgi:hypothetical protein